MRQHVITLFLLITGTSVFANTSLTPYYEDFQKTKAQFFNSKLTKKDFSKKFKELDVNLNATYGKLKIAEKEKLSTEGNQLALDLELLSPLRNLASTKMNKENCLQAKHLNSVNATTEEKEQHQLIEKVISIVCK